jgi:hypothetical protein
MLAIGIEVSSDRILVCASHNLGCFVSWTMKIRRASSGSLAWQIVAFMESSETVTTCPKAYGRGRTTFRSPNPRIYWWRRTARSAAVEPEPVNNQIHRAVTRELTAKGLREVKPGKSRLSGALLGLRELLRRMKVQAESKGLSSTKMGDPPKVQPSLPSLWTEAWPQRSLPPIRTNWDTSRSIICG